MSWVINCVTRTYMAIYTESPFALFSFTFMLCHVRIQECVNVKQIVPWWLLCTTCGVLATFTRSNGIVLKAIVEKVVFISISYYICFILLDIKSISHSRCIIFFVTIITKFISVSLVSLGQNSGTASQSTS